MRLLYRDKAVFVHCFHHQLGSLRRDLDQLKAEKLLIGTAENLAAMGYRCNFGLDKGETLLSLTTGPIKHARGVSRRNFEPRIGR